MRGPLVTLLSALLLAAALSMPARAGLFDDDEARKRRDNPLVGAHLLCAGFVFLLSGYAGDFDHAGRVVVAFLVTALFVFRDLRPDLVQALAPRA